MKKIKLFAATLIVFGLFHIVAKAQNDCFPMNSYIGHIEIKDKVLIEGKTKNEILNKLIAWGTSKHTSQVGREMVKDKDACVYKIYVAINYTYKGGFRTMFYAITMISSDGYFEYTVNDFIMNKKPMEEYLIEKAGDEYYDASFGDICKKMNYTLNSLKELK